MVGNVVIVGAGAGGLAVAATLARRGVPYSIVEQAESVGAAWSGRYDSLRLHTVRWLSGLPGLPIPRSYGSWVARDDFVQYLREYAEHFCIRPEFGVTVHRIDRTADGWALQTSEAQRNASAVVVATGYSRVPHVPDWPGQRSFTRPITHSSEYRDPSGFTSQRVLVVGAGNSAAEIASDLVRVGADVTLSVRTPPNIVPRDTHGFPSQLLGITLRRVPEPVMNLLTTALRRVTVPDLAAHGLPTPKADGFTQFLRTRTVPILDHGFVEQVRSGSIKVVAAVDHLDGHEVKLVDGSALRPDSVITATGFRPGLDQMVGHLGVLDERGMPIAHGARTAPGAPGLHFVGIEVQLAGLLREIGLEARSVGQVLAAS